MRISTITNWAYGITVLLTGLSGAAFLYAAHTAEMERLAVERHLQLDALAEDLAVGTATLTNEARLYAVRKSDRHLAAYRQEAEADRRRDRALQAVKSQGATPAELSVIAEADRDLAELTQLERTAVEAVTAGRAEEAQAVLFGPDHERAEAGVLAALNHFRAQVTTRSRMEMLQAKRETDEADNIAKAMLGLTALLFLAVLYFVLRRRVSMPLTQMTGIVKRLAKRDFTVDVPLDRRRDEIGDITQAIAVFKENGLERERLEAERQADLRTKDCLLQMMHRLQACQDSEELAEVVACFAPQTFPDLAGRLYVLDEAHNGLTAAGDWLEPKHSGQAFAANTCWGLRRGRPHVSHGGRHDVSCAHVNEPTVASICIPLTAQGDTIGLLYFEERTEVETQGSQRAFLDLLADNIALALANLRLRERLASLAVRDGLTGLSNRRSLDEALRRHAADPADAVACIMVDIDHFKRFNDDFGHDAGDAVMQHVAQIMREVVGTAGTAYRFGGEEFTVLLPGAGVDAAFAVAERLRSQVGDAALAHHGRMLGRITISLGVSASPEDGPAGSLLRSADAALLQAKSGGRNRTVLASLTAAPGRERTAAA